MPDSLSVNQVILGFDFGLKYIGVAVGQTLTRTAQPLTTLTAHAGIPDWKAIAKLITAWQPQALVVGIPLNMDGSEQPLTHAAKRFSNALKKHFTLPVYSMDERLSTVAARAELFEYGGHKALKKEAVDSLAAKLILESWLATHKS